MALKVFYGEKEFGWREVYGRKKPSLSTFQKFTGRPLQILKRPGANNSSKNCGRIPRRVFYSAHTRPYQLQ